MTIYEYNSHSTNRTVYPVTAAFEDYYDNTVEPAITDESGDDPHGPINKAFVVALYKVMASNLGEYEHGSADVDQVFENLFGYVPNADEDDRPYFKQLMQAYRAVCEDVLMSLVSYLT